MNRVQQDLEEYFQINKDVVEGLSQVEKQPDRQFLQDQPLQYATLEGLSEERFRYLRYLRLGHEDLLRQVWEDEKKAGHSLKDEQCRAFLEAGCQILCTLPSEVLLDIMSGEMVSKYLSSSPSQTKTYLQENAKMWKAQKSGKRYQPVIYQHWLTDRSGNPPSRTDIERIVSDLTLYLQDSPQGNDFAQKVDTAVHGCPKVVWVERERRYLTSDRHFARTRGLRNSMLEASKGTILRPFVETGYTNNAHTRLRQHQTHKNSNRMMNLVEALCKINYPHLKIHQFVVFQLWAYDQVWAGEILFDRLSGGWFTEGHGFTFYHAGTSVNSSMNFTEREWNEWQLSPFIRMPQIKSSALLTNTRLTAT